LVTVWLLEKFLQRLIIVPVGVIHELPLQTVAKELIQNNMNKFVVRYFKDQALSGLEPIPDQGRGQDSDKTVINPW